MYIFHYEIDTNINANKSDNKTYIYIYYFTDKNLAKNRQFFIHYR